LKERDDHRHDQHEHVKEGQRMNDADVALQCRSALLVFYSHESPSAHPLWMHTGNSSGRKKKASEFGGNSEAFSGFNHY
jgi:hypothetical protein